MSIINSIKDRLLYPHRYNNKAFIKYLKRCGVTIGENTYFFSPKTTTIDVQNSIFITIGSNCKITKGCTILAHDYSYSILRPIYHTIPKKAGLTQIGNNCFIGINSIILMGSNIGNNCIIGAGSVVSEKIPDNQVWAGNPARFICTLDDYYKKCTESFENNAFLVVDRYKKIKKRYPTIQELQYFSLLFLNNDKKIDAKNEIQKMSFNGDRKKEVVDDCLEYKSRYDDYENFIRCYEKTRNIL